MRFFKYFICSFAIVTVLVLSLAGYFVWSYVITISLGVTLGKMFSDNLTEATRRNYRDLFS